MWPTTDRKQDGVKPVSACHRVLWSRGTQFSPHLEGDRAVPFPVGVLRNIQPNEVLRGQRIPRDRILLVLSDVGHDVEDVENHPFLRAHRRLARRKRRQRQSMRHQIRGEWEGGWGVGVCLHGRGALVSTVRLLNRKLVSVGQPINLPHSSRPTTSYPRHAHVFRVFFVAKISKSRSYIKLLILTPVCLLRCSGQKSPPPSPARPCMLLSRSQPPNTSTADLDPPRHPPSHPSCPPIAAPCSLLLLLLCWLVR